MFTPDIGPCVLCVAEVDFGKTTGRERSLGPASDQTATPTMDWTDSIDRELKTYRARPRRMWKFLLFQKDSMKNFDLVLSDCDFQSMYTYFSKREKQFFDLFRTDLRLMREDILSCLNILGQKISVQRTDTGTVMVLDALRKPNPAAEEAAMYIPLKEFVRQQTILGEGMLIGSRGGQQTQYSTNARETVLQTSSKYAGKYLHVTVYFMIPLSMAIDEVLPVVDSWKIKVRVVATGRCYIADIDLETYKKFLKKQDEMEKEIESMMPRSAGKDETEEDRPEVSEPLSGEAVRSIPRNLVLQQCRANRGISPDFIANAVRRESHSLSSEPEQLAQRKQLCIVFVLRFHQGIGMGDTDLEADV